MLHLCVVAAALCAPLATYERHLSMLEELFGFICIVSNLQSISLTDFGASVFASVEAAISVQEVGLFWY